MKDFIAKVALITGAASGIGRGIAIKCAREKMKLVIVDIDKDNLEVVQRELLQITPDVLALHKDVANLADVKEIVACAQQQYTTVNLLVNNAGVSGPFGPIWELPLEQLEWTLNVNLKSVTYTLQSIVPLMLKQNDECHIVNVSSHVGLITNPHLTAYQITKHAITTLTEALQQDLAIVGSAKINTSIFFPYFVKSNLANSGRHLIGVNQLYLSQYSRDFSSSISALTVNGIDPLEAAEILFNGIINNKLYIFTNEETKRAFKSRVESILD